MFSSRLIVLAVLLCGVTGSTQFSTIPVTSTNPGSPVMLRGNITAIAKQHSSGHLFSSFEGNVLTVNVSSREIVLFITKLRAVGFSADVISNIGFHDYFFSSETFKPSETKLILETGPPVLEGPVVPRSAGPSAHVEGAVLFVQFVDGSSWGDLEAANDALRQRSLVWQKLKFLAEILRTKGEEQFVAELLRPHEPGFLGDAYIELLRSAYRDSHEDPRAAIEQLNSMLRAADKHQLSMGTVLEHH